MAPWFSEKPPLIQAKQFTGGMDSGAKIIEWLMRSGAVASYLPAIEPYVDPDGRGSHDGLPESVRLHGAGGQVTAVARPMYWIVKAPHPKDPNQFFVVSDAEFLATYILVKAD